MHKHMADCTLLLNIVLYPHNVMQPSAAARQANNKLSRSGQLAKNGMQTCRPAKPACAQQRPWILRLLAREVQQYNGVKA